MSELLAAGPAPLADVRIVAVEQYGAGPWGTMQLSDLGAEVIKIEDPAVGGDVARYVPPFQEGESSLFFEAFNRGKRSVSLDLKRSAGRAVFEDLVRCSDAVFSNLRGDQPDRLRLRYADLQGVNPTIVCCSLSGFGTTGPRASEGAYDYTIQGLAGWQAITGDPDGPPVKSALSLVDFCGGYVAALAIVAGVWRARRDGRGADVDLSLFEVALAQLNYIGTWVASRGYEPVRRRNSAHQSIVPFQTFATADGWLVVACPKQSLWEQLCTAIERPDLAAPDGPYATFSERGRNRDALLAELEAVFAARTTAEWLEALVPARVPCAPVEEHPGCTRRSPGACTSGRRGLRAPGPGARVRARKPIRLRRRPTPFASRACSRRGYVRAPSRAVRLRRRSAREPGGGGCIRGRTASGGDEMTEQWRGRFLEDFAGR